MAEYLYYVDQNDKPTGEVAEKLLAHNSDTKLHAAFSCYVFNNKGQFLVTQRAHTKKVWHGVWTNSCCGHPGVGESREASIKRRLQYELGLVAGSPKLMIAEYIYKTPPYNGIIEHEYCPVYVSLTSSDVIPNPAEVEDYRWVDWDWYVQELKNDSDDYSMFEDSIPLDSELGSNHIPKWSWWCKDQLKHLENNKLFLDFLDSLKSK
jgi:isopentenyl-diphosphate delta-isomerase